MKINTTGRKCTLKPTFLSNVEEKLGKLDKFFPEEVQAHVTVTVEKDWQTVEITIKDRYASFRSEKSAPKMEVALEAAVEKLESMIVKNKSKISRKHKGSAYKYEELPVLPAGEAGRPRACHRYDQLAEGRGQEHDDDQSGCDAGRAGRARADCRGRPPSAVAS